MLTIEPRVSLYCKAIQSNAKRDYQKHAYRRLVFGIDLDIEVGWPLRTELNDAIP